MISQTGQGPMMTMTPGRRTLRYEGFDDIMADVDRLLDGHATVGQWTLAQICRHLSAAMRRSVEVPESTPREPSRRVGERMKRRFFESGQVPEGIPTMPSLLPAESLDERAEAEGLRQAISHYRAS